MSQKIDKEKKISPVDTQRLKNLIKACGKTRKEIADDLGMTVAAIASHVTGVHSIPIATLIKYAKYFNVSLDYLCGLTDVKEYDMDKRAIAYYTGLGITAIESLHLTTEYWNRANAIIISGGNGNEQLVEKNRIIQLLINNMNENIAHSCRETSNIIKDIAEPPINDKQE